MHSVTKLIEAQSQMVAKAMIAQSFPQLLSFTGENDEESFEHWFESFEDRAKVAGWSPEQSLYQLILHELHYRLPVCSPRRRRQTITERSQR